MKPVSKHHVSIQEMQEEYLIIEQAKKDIDAFKPLYNKYYNEIKQCIENILYINYNIKNEELVKDLTASVFENAILKLNQYKAIDKTPFKSWLYRIMQNEITGYIRKTATREKHQRYIEQHTQKYDEISVYNAYTQTEEVKINYLKKCIPKLTDNDKLLIQYRFFNDYSYKEISKIMGLSENSLRTRMTRLLKKIQMYIETKSF